MSETVTEMRTGTRQHNKCRRHLKPQTQTTKLGVIPVSENDQQDEEGAEHAVVVQQDAATGNNRSYCT
jgi:hypothetical protein